VEIIAESKPHTEVRHFTLEIKLYRRQREFKRGRKGAEIKKDLEINTYGDRE
jgi:hypothetical protein